MKLFFSLFSLIGVVFLNSCGSRIPDPPKDVKPEEAVKAEWINPFPAGTYEHFKAEKSYPKTYSIYKNTELLSQTNPSNSRIKLNLKTQRGLLMKGDTVVIDYPISAGRSKYPTPTGSYTIVEKKKDKRSNLYGKILNSSGGVVKSNADSRKDKVPEGGKFQGSPMPYWMRLTWDGIGHHVGRVPRYPASHGCIRGVKSIMPTVYSKTKIGTPVLVSR